MNKCQQEFEKWCNNKKKYSGGQECLPIDNWWMVWQAAWEAAIKQDNKCAACSDRRNDIYFMTNNCPECGK